jgi:hypothetical protein
MRLTAEEEQIVGITGPGRIVGTLDYMAPEQFESGAVDIRADIYGLGCTLHHLLAGAPPFPAPNYSTHLQKMRAHTSIPAPPIRTIRADAPESLGAILEQMLAKAPNDRMRTPADVARLLAPLARGHGAHALAAAADGAAGAIPQGTTVSVHSHSEAVTLADEVADNTSQVGAQKHPDQASTKRSLRERFGPTLMYAAAVAILAPILALALWPRSRSRHVPLSAPAPLRITSLAVDRFRDRGTDQAPLLYGAIGKSEFEAVTNDIVRVSATLSEPAYCYLVAFNPDGSIQPCSPRRVEGRVDVTDVGEATTQFEYPRRRGKYFALTDGRGEQVFVLLASRTPLPLDGKRVGWYDGAPWQAGGQAGLWLFDATDIEPVHPESGGQRGTEVDLRPGRLVELVQFFKERAGDATFRGIAFPVR